MSKAISSEPAVTVGANGQHADHADAGAGHQRKAGTAALMLGSIGVVYGDIGTSPLYAFREALKAAKSDGTLTTAEVLGVTSLILWALILIVTIKYVIILLRADNNGEGGTLALMALARRVVSGRGRVIFALGAIAASLFYGDAIITPAISVLSAVEGLKLVTPAFEPYILPITIGIIIALFAVQAGGTERMAKAFGPITLVWFIAMGATGFMNMIENPAVLAAINPYYAFKFMAEHGVAALIAFGAVFLAVTGAEALYADLGHFGRKPIQYAWFIVVLPALALNYFGQAAFVLNNPEGASDPFFLMTPEVFLVPMVILATIATIVASQAVITGAFSLSRAAIQLGLLPRLDVQHTSATQAGQIYMPQVNRLLFIGVVLLVMMFRSSTSLAAAYGIAVTGTMLVTAAMAYIVIWKFWKWHWAAAAALIGPFFIIELAFLGANLMKVADGGWVPLGLSVGLMTIMVTWMRGTKVLLDKTKRTQVPLADLMAGIGAGSLPRVPGTAIFLTTEPELAPSALLHNLKHNKVLHEQNVILTVRYASTPRVPVEERVEITKLSGEFVKVVLNFGFMESPNIPKVLGLCRKKGLHYEIMKTSFFLSRRSIRSNPKAGMPGWQDKLFIGLARNASNATDFFGIPTDRVVEVGSQVTV